jgi:hypothetical protein
MSDLLPIVISVVALVATAALAVRQVALMRHANHLPILVELIQELRSPAFLEKERYVSQQLAADYPRELGLEGLDDQAADQMQYVKSFFNSLGALVFFGMIRETLAISLFGYRATRVWSAIEPFVLRERELRGSDMVYAPFFEDFVARVRITPPGRVVARLHLRSAVGSG